MRARDCLLPACPPVAAHWPPPCAMPPAVAPRCIARPTDLPERYDDRRCTGYFSSTTPPAAKRTLATLRELLPYLRPYRALIVAWLCFLALSSSATLSLPVAVRLMIDRGFGAGDPSGIDRWFLGLLGVASVLAVATAGRFYFISVLGERAIADLRDHLVRHLLTLDMAFFERTRAGELVSRLSADTELLRSVMGSTVSVALRSTVTFLGSAAMLAITSPRLRRLRGGNSLTILPIMLYGRYSQSCRASQDRVADANARASETLGAMHTVQSYARRRARRGASARPCAPPSPAPGAASAPRRRSPPA